VAEYLISLNLEVKTGVAKTGVVGFLLCNEAGKTVALRADIDALPMQEKNDVPVCIHQSWGHAGLWQGS
jgi:amidohydrolase